MKIEKKEQNSTSVTMLVTLDAADIKPAHDKVVRRLGKNVKVDGFRAGKAPIGVIEKSLDQNQLANEILNELVPPFIGQALDSENISTVIPPQVNVTKFVPYTEIEFEVIAEFLGSVKLADYKKLKKTRPNVDVTQEEIDNVTKRIQFDMAERADVKRASKKGDQVWIDFEGKDEKGNSVSGAKGEDYPLALGSDTFIPGFEDNLIGLKAGDTKEFTLTFPKDYGVKALQNKKVTFVTTVKKVQSVTLPEIDDTLAKKIGPYASSAELLADIEKQIKADKIHKTELEIESDIMSELADASEIEMPEGMIKEQIDRMIADHKANLQYRGQTYDAWLEAESITEEQHRDQLRDEAIKRLKGGVILSEIAKQEGIELSEAEISEAVNQYKTQYAADPKMQAELEKPAARRDIAARILTDRTLAHLKNIVIKN